MSNREVRYIINSDEDITYLFEQYDKVGIKDINMFIKFLLMKSKITHLALPPIPSKP